MCARQRFSPLQNYPPGQPSPCWRYASQEPTTVTWRTDDQRPICFYCAILGHVLRNRHRFTNNIFNRLQNKEHYDTLSSRRYLSIADLAVPCQLRPTVAVPCHPIPAAYYLFCGSMTLLCRRHFCQTKPGSLRWHRRSGCISSGEFKTSFIWTCHACCSCCR